MSYEYFAPVRIDSVIHLVQMFESPEMRARIDILSATPSEVLLRWLDVPKRSEWPEDITVALRSDGLLVSFHTDTASSRSDFLWYMRTRLIEEIHTTVEFEEA
jgi:hypothetical protein